MARAGTADFCKEKRRLVPALPKNRPKKDHHHRLPLLSSAQGVLELRHFSCSNLARVKMGKIASLHPKPADLAGSKAVKCSTKISVKGQDEYVSPASPGTEWVVANFLVELSRTIAGNLLNSNLRARSTSLAHFNLGQPCLKDHAIRAQILHKMEGSQVAVMASNVCLGFACGSASNQKLTLA